MKRNLVGKILGKIKVFVQDYVPIRSESLKYIYIFLVLYAAYFVVREAGIVWGGKTLMEE